MITIVYNHKRLRVNLYKFITSIFTMVFIGAFIWCAADVCRYPEKHLPTWRYQLQNEINAGNQRAISYYKQRYTSKGIFLYGEDKKPLNGVLSLAEVTGYDEIENGVLLRTVDGNGYYIEK